MCVLHLCSTISITNLQNLYILGHHKKCSAVVSVAVLENILVQNCDVMIKTIYDLVDIFEKLEGANDIHIRPCEERRWNHSAKLDTLSFNPFRNGERSTLLENYNQSEQSYYEVYIMKRKRIVLHREVTLFRIASYPSTIERHINNCKRCGARSSDSSAVHWMVNTIDLTVLLDRLNIDVSSQQQNSPQLDDSNRHLA